MSDKELEGIPDEPYAWPVKREDGTDYGTDGLAALTDYAVEQHGMAVSSAAGRIPIESLIPEQPIEAGVIPDMTAVGRSMRGVDRKMFDGIGAVQYFEREYPELSKWVPMLKAADLDIYRDFPLQFKNPLDLLSFPAYLTEKGIMTADYQADRIVLDKPAVNDAMDDEWKRFRYTANPVFKAGGSWLHSIWAANDGKKVLMALNPVAPLPVRAALAKEIIENASKHFVGESKNDHPWAAANPEMVSQMYYIPLDVSNFLNIPMKALREAGHLADVQKLTPHMAEVIKIAREGLAEIPVGRLIDNPVSVAQRAKAAAALGEVVADSKKALAKLTAEGKKLTPALLKEEVYTQLKARKEEIEKIVGSISETFSAPLQSERLGKNAASLEERLASLKTSYAKPIEGLSAKEVGLSVEELAARAKSFRATGHPARVARADIMDREIARRGLDLPAIEPGSEFWSTPGARKMLEDAERVIFGKDSILSKMAGRVESVGKAAADMKKPAAAFQKELDGIVKKLTGHEKATARLSEISAETATNGERIASHTKQIGALPAADKIHAPASESDHLGIVASRIGAYLAEHTSGGTGLYNGTVPMQVLNWVRGGLGTGTASATFSAPGTIEDAATLMYHHMGFRGGSQPASWSLPFADYWRKPSELHYGPVKEQGLAAMDAMRSFAASKRAAIDGLDLKGRVGAIANLTYPQQRVVDDVLYALKTVQRSSHDVAGSFERSFLTLASGDSRLGRIPQTTVDLARDVAVRLGHGWNGHGAFETAYSLRQSTLDNLKKGGAPTLDDTFKTAQNYTKEALGKMAESAPLETFAKWVAGVETRVPRDLRMDVILKELEGVRANAEKTLEVAIKNGWDTARMEASGVMRVADNLRDDLKGFKVNTEMPSAISGEESGFIIKTVKSLNNVIRQGQLFLQPVTALKNATNSILEKGMASGVKASDAIGDAWAYLRGGQMRPASVDLLGQPQNYFTDPSLFQTGKSGVRESYPSIFSLSPAAKMTHGENLARQATGEATYASTVAQLRASFPNMTKEQIHTKAAAASSEAVANTHFNSDDVPKAAHFLRLMLGYPDFNIRDLGFALDLAAKYPAQALAVGRTLDLLNMGTHGNGLRVGKIPGTEQVIRIDMASVSGFAKTYERVFDWRPTDPHEADRARAEGDAALVGLHMRNYAQQGLHKLAGGFLPHASMALHSTQIVPQGSAPTINAWEAAMNAVGKNLMGVDVQTSDTVESLMGRNPGEDRNAFARRRTVAYAEGAKLENRELGPTEALRERNEQTLYGKAMAMFMPGVKVMTDGEHQLSIKLAKAKSMLISAGDNSLQIEAVKADIRTTPELAATSAILPLSPNEWGKAAGRRVEGFAGMPAGGEPPENYTFDTQGSTSAMAAAYSGEPVPVQIDVTTLPRETIKNFTPPDSYVQDPATGMLVPKWKVEPRNMSVRERQIAGVMLNRVFLETGMVAQNPKQFLEMVNERAPWALSEVDRQFKWVRENNLSADVALGPLIPGFTAINLARSGGNFLTVNDTALPHGMQGTVRRATDWWKSEVSRNGLDSAQMREIASSPESIAAYARGELALKPSSLPQTFDVTKAVDSYTLDRVNEAVGEGHYGIAEKNALNKKLGEYPEFHKRLGELQAGVRRPETITDAISNLNRDIQNGDAPPDAWTIIDKTSTFKTLYEEVGVAASYPEAKSVMDRLIIRNKDGRAVDINEAGLFSIAFNPRMEPLRPLLQAARAGRYGPEIAGAVNQGIASTGPKWNEEFDKRVPADSKAEHFREEADLASGNYKADFAQIIGAVAGTGLFTPAPKATAATTPPRTQGQPGSVDQVAALTKDIPKVDTSAWFGNPVYARPEFTSVSGIIRASIADWNTEKQRMTLAGTPELTPELAVTFGANLKHFWNNSSPSAKASVGAGAVQAGIQIGQSTGAFDGMSQDGNAAIMGLSTGISTMMMLGGPANPVGIVVGAGVGILAGFRASSKKGGQSSYYNEENLRINRERLELQREEFIERNRQTTVRDLRTNQSDLVRSVQSGRQFDRTAAAERLAQFQRRPSYGSKIGLVDALTRQLAPAMKPTF